MRKLIILSLITLCFPAFALAHGGTDDAHNIIRMTENGFEPKELTITQGDEVLFINNGNVAHWPASNFHPTHTLYPEFDPLKGIPPGESWKFKFEKVGTWRMHDHLFPHLTGTITVKEDPDAAATQSKDQKSSPDSPGLTRWGKIKIFFLKLFRMKTPAEAMIMTSHDTAHLKGQLLFKESGLDGLAFCTADFAFGCYHGIMEVAFENDRGDEEAYKSDILKAQEGCRKLGDDTSAFYWSCIHGMGHGTATFRDHDLGLALKDCDVLGQVKTYCYDGVFMEFSISAPPSFYKSDDPIYPCDTLDPSYRIACARSQVTVMQNRFQMKTGKIVEACEKTGDQNIIYHCVDALGFSITHGHEGDASAIVAGCGEITDEAAAAQCSAAAAGELVFQNALGWQNTSAAVCQSLKGKYIADCQRRIEQVKASYGRK